MLAPDVGSTNVNVDDKIPLMQNSIFKRLSYLLGRSSPIIENDGYVEFGAVEEPSNRTLGMFAGVFSPVALSMISALMFLRVGYLVGNAGLFVTLVQFGIAYVILIFTVSSICAISSNGAVEGGGAYFMISRTLGPEFGGATGTLFFLANVVSSALCISGCVEGLVENIGPSGYIADGWIPDGYWYRFLYCLLLNTLNLLICLIGADMFARTSAFVLAVVIVCLGITFVSFFEQKPMQVAIPDTNTLVQNATHHVFGAYTGMSAETLKQNMWSDYGQDYTSHGENVTFATVFGVLFSGVTGIMAGANMSGELKDAGRSIPMGTLSAVAFTLVLYAGVSLLTAATCGRFLLQNNYLYMAGISVWPVSVTVGILTATWTASLSNVIGGSRVLQALAKDRVFGASLDLIPRGTWRGNPIAAVLVSWLLVQSVLFVGSLNVIAQLNSVLFLLSYLAMNLSCLGLELASAPNFRPTFKYFTWHTALIGLIGTVVMMFVISPLYAACSILLCLILFVFLHLFSPSKGAQWGSISQALIFHQVRKYLLLLDSRKDHVKFWRPQMLLLVDSPRSACPLVDFINDSKKSGLYVLGHVIEGENNDGPDVTLEMMPHWLSFVDHMKVKAFVELTVAKSVRDGLQHLMRMSGMGAMKPNTVVLGFPDKRPSKDFLLAADSPYRTGEFADNVFPIRKDECLDVEEYVAMIGDVLRFNKNICLCRNFANLRTGKKSAKEGQFLDVWPVNFTNPSERDAFDTTSLFMMQLACIVNMVPKWSKLTLRVYVCDDVGQTSFALSASSGSETYSDRLNRLLEKLRIEAKIYPISGWNEIVESHPSDIDIYLRNVNRFVKQHSDDTVVTFVYLPPPPDSSGSAAHYLDMLDKITTDLPPTVLVHGVSTVTSTTL